MLTQAYNLMMKRFPSGLNNFRKNDKKYSVSLPTPCIRPFRSRGCHSVTIMNHEG